MKTKYFSAKNSFLKSCLGLLGFAVVSCGTYQNKSYYDNDGIYGADKPEKQVVSANTTNDNVSETNQKYKEYFGSNANNYSDGQNDSFTDVENYSSENDSIKRQNEYADNSNYGGWGTNSDNVTINVYDNSWGGYNYGYWNNYWGYRPWNFGISLGWSSWNYGWCNPYWNYGYYGPSWGYNPYYGGYYGGYYGYNNWNNSGYYGNNYAYHHNRRGSAYHDRYSDGNGVRNYTPNRRNNSSITPRPRNNGDFVNPRSNYQTPPKRDNVRPRTNDNNGNNNQVNTPRPRRDSPKNSEINTPRPRTTTPRNENATPRSYDSPRSNSPSSGGMSPSNGGGRSGGGRRG